MELLFAIVLGCLTTSGVYLVLRARTFPVVVGMTLLSYAINYFLFAMGRLHSGKAPIIGTGDSYADPLPQALVLTAIVISFGMTAFSLILALRLRSDSGTDHADGREDDA